jgi:predicted transcriptional regulator of viral defense system
MSSINEIKNQSLLENKPFFTKSEAGLLLDKKGKNLDKKISQLLKKQYLIHLKRGLYTTKIYSDQHKNKLPEFIANTLYYPSYLSLKYVLQQEGMIPEAVYTFTSITLKKTRQFENPLGIFHYRNIKPQLFTGYTQVPFTENYQIKIATKAKALFDYLYLYVFRNQVEQELFIDMRINWENFSQQDLKEFSEFTQISQSKKMAVINKILQQKL